MAGCQEVAGLLHGLAVGDLPAGDRAAVEAHAAACASCAKETARLRDNAAYLQDVLGTFRMPPEFPADFLLALPPKDGKRRAPAGAPAAPRTVVLGDTSTRRFRAGPLLLGAGMLGGVVVLGWLFLGPEKEVQRREVEFRTVPDVKERAERGKGAADGKAAGTAAPAPNGGKPPAPGEGVRTFQAMRTAADLLAALRGVRGDAWGPAIARGWDLLAGTPAEAAAVRDAAAAEKEPGLRAALVLVLAADGREETRATLRGWLSDPSPEVRGAAALGLARSLSYENPSKRAVPAGPPLGLAVQVGALEDDPGRADLALRLGQESEESVRRILLQVLGPTAGADPQVRDRILDGVKGAYGDEMRETCVRALAGVQDPAIVPGFAEALGNPGTPRALHPVLIEGMMAADQAAAAEALAGLIPAADGADFRRTLVVALGKAGGASAESTLLRVLSGDGDASVRMEAVRALQKYPSRASLDAAEAASENDADQAVRTESERIARILRPTVEKMEGGPAGGDDGGGGDPHPQPEPPPEGGG